MAAKKKSKKKVAKKVAPVEVPADPEQEVATPAIVEEATMKVVESGQATYYTESEYRAKYG